jgi:hypothetical protein
VAELGDDLGFTLESLSEGSIQHAVQLEDLDRNLTVDAQLLGPIHDGEATLADDGAERVTAAENLSNHLSLILVCSYVGRASERAASVESMG